MNETLHILLQGVVGSRAYGLAGPDSDTDRAGIFAHPTRALLGLSTPVGTLATHEPGDLTLHEAKKALQLLLGGNPTATEILYLPDYEIRTQLGDELICLRSAFPTAKRVKDAYLGYAGSQFKKLLARGGRSFDSDIPPARTAKHARHLMRLVEQGYQLYTTGTVTVRLENPQAFLDFGEQVAADPATAAPYMAAAEDRFAAADTVLPDTPRLDAIEAWLLRVRHHYYTQEI